MVQHMCISMGCAVKQTRLTMLGRRPRRSARSNAATRTASAISTTPKQEEDKKPLGDSDVVVSPVGAGVWAWGDGYWGPQDKEANRDAFNTLMDGGVTFLDTAEVYGVGKSETFTGDFIREEEGGSNAQVATKFAPLPWRFARRQHWPGFGGLPSFGNENFLDGLADCYDAGLCDAVGVSNFNAQRVRNADDKLRSRGLTLASNQVQFSLLYRAPERNGVLEACREKDVTLIAYSPLAQGLLTGKYGPDTERPAGPRRAIFSQNQLRGIQPLIELMREVGARYGDKTPAQVAIRYCIDKGTLPIPGAKNNRQAEQVVGSLGWKLEQAEIEELEKKADDCPSSTGAPFENF